MATTPQTLLDTARLNDALACGYKAPTHYADGGLKVSFEDHPALGPCITLNGVEGEITLTGEAEINAVIREMGLAIARSSARRAGAPALAMAAE